MVLPFPDGNSRINEVRSFFCFLESLQIHLYFIPSQMQKKSHHQLKFLPLIFEQLIQEYLECYNNLFRYVYLESRLNIFRARVHLGASLQSCSLVAIWEGHTSSKVSGITWLAMPIIKTACFRVHYST